MPTMATIKAKKNQPCLSPLGLALLAEKKRMIGVMTTPTRLAPMVEPTLAKVEVFSLSRESRDKAGIMAQKPVSLNE